MKLRGALLALFSATLLAACPTPSKVGCAEAPAGVVEALQPTITTAGTLRYATARQGEQAWFVTVELHEPDQDEFENGDLLTFATTDLNAGSFAAVDEKAREHSNLPDSELHVDADGGVESRGCTATIRDEDEAESQSE